ncbi:PolC-type DNA polymerase III [Flavobacterium sp. S87F.05.LMB.W.Kidney.N]|uniref:3'-5' exonuclease n=1 Tax=Flavobacterium sp. S87F.05.LMB.W.Kidney.N TaxID=1278758 RepID=UPI0010669028|nr:3'-5' exonuclease [Flavobacterium sp. S87F.05.LMB.W.Kidney.N]TDX11623.1 DNA polymerase-3 subunit epsilon [Flavobacterium sp. S87F.05.LMB.W.Kidney.N]
MNLFNFWKKEENNLFDENITIEETRFVVLDTETTGFDYENDRMLCIGALVLQNGIINVQDSFEIYLEQDHYDKSTAQIHGILKDLLVKRPTELEALQQFLDFLGDSIIIAHHTIFDVTMINKALERNGLPHLTNKTLDTAYLYKKTLIQSHLFERKDHYTLDDLADKFDISKKDRHTALGDAYITAIAFLKIVKKLREKKEVNLNQLFK